MRKRYIFLTAVFIGILCVVIQFVHGINGMASWQMGMVELHLPSGTNVYVRRQTSAGAPEDLYLSASADYCAPYNRWHDYKLPAVIHGGPQSPLLVSYSGDTIIVHAPKEPNSPWLSAPKSFKVGFQPLTSSEYSTYIALPQNSNALPEGWQRIEVAFGHNTCSL
jgi:hypothetical protein